MNNSLIPELNKVVSSIEPQVEKLEVLIQSIKPKNKKRLEESRAFWNTLCKPLYSFGRLESIVSNLAALQECLHPETSPSALFCFVADNGVVEEGVTQTGQEVTTQVMLNMAEGSSSVTILCENLGIDFYPVNVGSKYYKEKHPGIVECSMRAEGTRNFLKEPALTREEAVKALLCGAEMAKIAANKGYKMLIGGEMGIGNTTTSTACGCIILDLDPATVTGKGAGLSEEGLKRKIAVVQKAKELYQADKDDPIAVLSAVGGYDIATLAGFYLGAAASRSPIILDGLITYAAALIATKLAPHALDYFIPSHLPREKTAQSIAEYLGFEPMLDLSLAQGEGSGALYFLPLLNMTLEVYNKMPNFTEGEVEAYEDFENK